MNCNSKIMENYIIYNIKMRADHTHLTKIINILFKPLCCIIIILSFDFYAFMLIGVYDMCGCVVFLPW